jgi:hypothetical protein
MTLRGISDIRLRNQQIAGTEFKSAKEIVNWMGAMQSQDYAMSKWAIGMRLQNSTDKDIEEAIDKGEIIRTHLLRPTWHFISADDIYWVLKLTGPPIKAKLKSRHEELGLTESILLRCNSIIQNSLAKAKHLTREELISILENEKISTEGQRGYHILVSSELDAIICSGKIRGNEQTYALLEERVAKRNCLTREEALGKIAGKYFSSHGPASLQDFAWWSGLSVTEARNALEMVKSELISEKTDAQTLWASSHLPGEANDKYSAFLLPAFDEFIISYKDRRASLPSVNKDKAVSSNGIFRPVIVLNGQVIGLWNRKIYKDKVIVETNLFQSSSRSVRSQIEKATERLGFFLGKNPEIKHNK